MKTFSIKPNQQAEELFDQLLMQFGGTKIEVINILVDRYLKQEQQLEILNAQLEDERKMRKSILRNIERKVEVLYEVENTRLHLENLPALRDSEREKNVLIAETESYLEEKRRNEIFRHLEKRIVD